MTSMPEARFYLTMVMDGYGERLGTFDYAQMGEHGGGAPPLALKRRKVVCANETRARLAHGLEVQRRCGVRIALGSSKGSDH